MRHVPVVVVLGVVLGGVAHGEPTHVEVRALPGRDVPAEVVGMLRIYLASSATVDVGAPLAGATFDDRVAEAGRGSGGLVTWLERGPDERGAYTVVIVGRRAGRAAVEVGELIGDDTTALSRLLALKIGAFIDETIAAGAASPVAEPAPTATAAAPQVATTPRRIELAAEIGGGGALTDGDWRGEAAVGAGARRRVGRLHVTEVFAIGRLTWPAQTRASNGDVELGVIDAGATARWVTALGPLWVGVAGELAVRRVRATGVLTTGDSATAVRYLAMTRIGVDGRIDITPALAIRACIGIERGLEVERFTLQGMSGLATGELAGVGTLTLVVPLL